MDATTPTVLAVHKSAARGIEKQSAGEIRLVANHGVEGDVHAGETVQHASRMARDGAIPNLRQVHLVHRELHDELRTGGFDVAPGQMGENVTTQGIDLLALSTDTRLRLGDEAIVRLTGLRNPCSQLDGLAPGLMAAVLGTAPDGSRIRKSGVMAVVEHGGVVRPGDPIVVETPATHAPLAPV